MFVVLFLKWKCAVVSALDSGLNGPGSSPDRSHCVVALGGALYYHGASLHGH